MDLIIVVMIIFIVSGISWILSSKIPEKCEIARFGRGASQMRQRKKGLTSRGQWVRLWCLPGRPIRFLQGISGLFRLLMSCKSVKRMTAIKTTYREWLRFDNRAMLTNKLSTHVLVGAINSLEV